MASYQKYKLHMINGDVIEHNEPYDSKKGIVDLFCVAMMNRNSYGSQKAVELSTEFGPHAYFTWDKVCWIEATEVYKQ